MKILIIGSGYLGRAAAEYWLSQKHKVVLTTRESEKIRANPHLKFLFLENNNLLSLPPCDVLVVCTAPSLASDDYEKSYLNVAQQLTHYISKTLSLKHVIYTSSTSVYGEHEGAEVNEETPADTSHPQREILVKAEELVLSLSTASPNITVFRLGEICGPGRQIANRLAKMVNRTIPGTGNSITNLTHLTTILRAYDFALEKNLRGIFNLTEDLHITRRELYDQICQERGFAPITWEGDSSSFHSGNKCVSNAKLKKLGFVFDRMQDL